MKKRLPALFLVILFLLTACSPATGNGQDDGKVTLTIMGKKTDMEKDYIQRIFQLYEQSGRCHLRIIGIDDADINYDTAIQEAFSSGEAPDILFQFNHPGLNTLNMKDQFVHLENEEWVSDLTDDAKAYCQDSEGHLLGLPFWENSVSGCYYNKTIEDSVWCVL